MIRLTFKDIKPETTNHLNAVQQEILNEPSFELQVKKAISKWENKTGSVISRSAFDDIRATLISMCVGVEACVYCENNEATDIEHIFPKKIYPGKTFDWSNYVLACGKCNTFYKSDKFKIFEPEGTVSELDVKPRRGVYLQPPNEDALFINQRLEDPMDFLELDLINQQFVFVEKYQEGTREYLKAFFTKELLGLNTRAGLISARKNATKYFRDRIEKYVLAKESLDFNQLKSAVHDDFSGIDDTAIFDVEKNRVVNSIRLDIITYAHPTVWKELIRQRQNLPRMNSFFMRAPEALNW